MAGCTIDYLIAFCGIKKWHISCPKLSEGVMSVRSTKFAQRGDGNERDQDTVGRALVKHWLDPSCNPRRNFLLVGADGYHAELGGLDRRLCRWERSAAALGRLPSCP